ncbi:MAG: DUF6817 domain-containing protein [Polaromonas sp.]
MPSPSAIATRFELPEAARALLLRSGAMQTPHTGRVLFDHLLATCQQLHAWGNPQAVCMAGLFHSIYGTNAFTHQSLVQSQRAELQNAIGTDAEALAWLFCSIDRPHAILQGLQSRKPSGSTQLQGRAGAQHPGLAEGALLVQYTQLQALAEMECANLIEQASWGKALQGLYCAAIDNPGLLSNGALAALRSGLANKLQAPLHQQALAQRQAA